VRKVFIAAVAFLGSAIAGVVLMVVGPILLVVLPQIVGRQSSGIGVVAGGVSGAALVVPLLCGVLGAFFALKRVNRAKDAKA
jgi:uncharacterized BrkB/YihY/UPF0761 family membrane protein